MEAMARDAGLEPVYIPELQREISPGLDLAAARRVLGLIREFKPHILHTHTAKAGTVGRLAALLAGPDRPGVVVHTFHGHVLARLLLDRSQRDVQAPRAAACPNDRRADRGQPGGAGRPRRARHRAGEQDRGRSPRAGPRRPSGGRGGRRRRGARRARDSRGSVRGRLARTDDGDQARRCFDRIVRGRRAPAVRRVPPPRRRRPASPRPRGSRGGARGARPLPVRGLQNGRRHGARGLRRRRALVGQRGHSCQPDRGSPPRGCPSSRPMSAASATWCRDGETGYLVPIEDPTAFADRLLQLADSPGLRRQLGEQGRAFVLPRYSVPRLVRDMDSLYRELLPRRRRARWRPALPRVLAAPVGEEPAAPPPADPPVLAVLPARGRGDPDPHAGVRGVPRRPRSLGHRGLRVPEPSTGRDAGCLPRVG